MKNLTLPGALALALSLIPAAAFAQGTIVTTAPATTTSTTTTAVPVIAPTTTTTATTSTTMAGTITEFTPASSQLIVRTTAGTPTTYAYTKQTTFVDEAGNIVSSETIRPGVPTTVYYTTVEGRPVVSKVVVTRTAAATAPVVPAVRSTTTETTETTTTTQKRK